jgi:HlyD family secretion protein
MKRACRLITLSVLVLLSACDEKSNDRFSGYVEAEYVRLASPIAGTLVKLYVQRGDRVEQNAPAFVLEQDSERAAREEAVSRVQRAQAQLADLQKGKRPDEVAAMQAQLAQAEAALQLSTANLARQKKLVENKFVSPANLDQARAALKRDRARVNELRAQLRLAKLGARSDEIDAAEQELKTAEAQLAQADWKLMQKTQRMPVEGEVSDVLYREGEWVQAGSPIVSILSPQNIKVRFFVPEETVGELRLGQQVVLRCDGCKKPMPARISYLSSAPEYTSPLIYSKENRSTLVFMIEARTSIDDARRLHPGQPVEVVLPPGMR